MNLRGCRTRNSQGCLFPQLDNDDIFWKSITLEEGSQGNALELGSGVNFKRVSQVSCSNLLTRLQSENSYFLPLAKKKKLRLYILQFSRGELQWQSLMSLGYKILGDREDLKASLNALQPPTSAVRLEKGIFGEEVSQPKSQNNYLIRPLVVSFAGCRKQQNNSVHLSTHTEKTRSVCTQIKTEETST